MSESSSAQPSSPASSRIRPAGQPTATQSRHDGRRDRASDPIALGTAAAAITRPGVPVVTALLGPAAAGEWFDPAAAGAEDRADF